MQTRYTRTTIFLHWLIAFLVLGQFALGWYMSDIPRGVPERGYVVNLHKSFGILIGLLVIFRLGWRLTHTPPPLPESVPQWQQQVAAGTHYLLYLLMLIMPLSGYVASNFSKYGINFFNTFKFSPWGYESKLVYGFFNQLHVVISWLLLALVVAHVLAALKHLCVDQDTIFFRIWPERSPRRR